MVRMKHTRISVAALAVALGIGIATYQSTPAQVKPLRPNLELASPDYHLVHTASYVYRYDSKTGATQRLNTTSQNGTGKNIQWEWLPILDQRPGQAGQAGRYEVSEGTGAVGILVRIDTSTGRTWAMVQTSVVNWQEVVK